MGAEFAHYYPQGKVSDAAKLAPSMTFVAVHRGKEKEHHYTNLTETMSDTLALAPVSYTHLTLPTSDLV